MTLIASGDLFLPKTITDFLYKYIAGSDTSLAYINYWSCLHFMSGVVLGLLLSPRLRIPAYFWTGLLVHALWELWQKFIGMTRWDLRGAIDTVIDFIIFGAGMILVYMCKYQGILCISNNGAHQRH